MPVCLNTSHTIDGRWPSTRWPFGEPTAEFRDQSHRSISIGLINNMPDGALETTERQFLALLDSASDGIQIRLSLYSLPGVSRNELGARHVKNFYSSVESLRNTQLDGLIVTGREPRTPNLADEPYWESFTRVVDWARDNTCSTVWSCLAAHAAILHLDGIGRIKNHAKHFGVFECTRVSDHPLMAVTPLRFNLPHSRWNGLPESLLTSCGYSVLTQAGDAGVDTFVKQYQSFFVFFQGHPEYESDTLLLEYCRDVGRYARGESSAYPSMPRGYFDDKTVATLTALQNESVLRPREKLLAEVSTALGKIEIENTWSSTAACIYRNWLEHICEQKQFRMRDSNAAAQPRGVYSPTLAANTAGTIPA